jgi:transposase
MSRRHQGRELNMFSLREVLRLGLSCGLSRRQIGRSLNMSGTTAGKYVSAAKLAGLSWQETEALDDDQLKKRLGRGRQESKSGQYPEPDWPQINQELKKKSVTLRLLWEEYKQVNPGGYQISQFCWHYHKWLGKQRLSFRHTYKAGEKMFVDYAGQTVPIYDSQTGTTSKAQIFIAVLGASNYTFAQAQSDQTIQSWINGHIGAFEYFNGVPAQTICDNLKSGVTKACWYEPQVNRAYCDMAAYYNTAIMPARVVKPRDKAKVECAVLVVERWILASLRNRKFFSIPELNDAIKELLIRLNTRPFKKLPGSRTSVFQELEQKELKNLPPARYILRDCRYARVNQDYHVDIDGHYYSVPWKLAGEQVDAYISGETLEIFHNRYRVASHKIDHRRGYHTTIKEHMPPRHAIYAGWSPEYFIDQAKTIGENAVSLFKAIFERRNIVEQGYRSCRGILRLTQAYPAARVESACARALKFKGYSYRSVSDILKNGLDKQPCQGSLSLDLSHENIRGKIYFINSQNQEVQ